jgi:mono/diheme cytochrome c family protein
VIVRLVLLVAVVLTAACVQAQDRDTLVTRGSAVFRDQGCYGCHTVGKMGTPIASDLSRIGAKHDEAYLARWLRDPAQQRPTAHMPKLELSESEVQALAAYLGSLK